MLKSCYESPSNLLEFHLIIQSKKGALWSRGPLEVPSFSVVLKFRISGKGKNFFGDGIAVWFVQQPYYSEGDVHGFQEQFIGKSVHALISIFFIFQ